MRKYTDAQIEKALDSIVVVVDTREKVWSHIRKGFDNIGCRYIVQGLNFGDYTYIYTSPEGVVHNCKNEIVVERKASAEEISINFTKGRQRFSREFERAARMRAEVFLIVENCNWSIIDKHVYRSEFTPKAFEGSLLSWCFKYNIRLQFCKSDFTATLIYSIFRYHLRHKLKQEEA